MGIIKTQYNSRLAAGSRPGRTQQDHIARYEFAAQYTAGKRVLDIACGTGYGTRILKEGGNAASVVGVDISPDMITYAQRNHAPEGVEYVCANAEEANDLGAFDLIVSFETIEHVHDYERTLQNLGAMLVPGGKLIMSTPNRPVTSPNAHSTSDTPDNQYHVREWSLPEFADVVRDSGFELPDEMLFGQSPPQPFPNRFMKKLNALFGWFEDPRYRVGVRSVAELPIIRFVTVVATKPITS